MYIYVVATFFALGGGGVRMQVQFLSVVGDGVSDKQYGVGGHACPTLQRIGKLSTRQRKLINGLGSRNNY